MILLDPVLGGKIRSVLITLGLIWVLLQQTWPTITDLSWASNVTKVIAVAGGIIEILTHHTAVGNVAGGD